MVNHTLKAAFTVKGAGSVGRPVPSVPVRSFQEEAITAVENALMCNGVHPSEVEELAAQFVEAWKAIETVAAQFHRDLLPVEPVPLPDGSYGPDGSIGPDVSPEPVEAVPPAYPEGHPCLDEPAPVEEPTEPEHDTHSKRKKHK